MSVLAIVLPVFLVVALGAVLTRTRFLGAELIGELNRLTYYVGLPVYLFTSIAGATFSGGRSLGVFGVMVGATLLLVPVGFLAARLLRVPPAAVGTFVHAATRGNLAFVGLPVVALALAAHHAEHEWPMALLAMAPQTIVQNILGVVLLLAGRPRPGAGAWRTLGRELATNPLLLASAAGAVFSAAGLALPVWLTRALGVVGQMALPLALLCIGGSLMVLPLRGRRTLATAVSVLKVAGTPLLGWLLARLCGLTSDEARIALIFLATPAAAASYTLACKLDGDEALAASSVAISTALSIVSLSLVLALV